MLRIGLVCAVASVVALVGCVPSNGVITQTTGPAPTAGKQVPDFQYVSAAGKQVNFDKVRYSVAILAFTNTPGASCCWLNPKIVSLADNLMDLPVTVAQIAMPTEPCVHGQGCVEVCDLHKSGLMSLCDGARVAWNAYGQPASGTVLLIDENNKIIQTGTLADLTALEAKARELGEAAEEEGTDLFRREMY